MKKLFAFVKKLLVYVWKLFTQPATKIGLGILVSGGFLAGVLFWSSFHMGLEATNTEKFCISCHDMEDNMLPELKKTIHWKNRSGVRAHCPDCHVPHDFTAKIARKMQASREVLGHFTGSIGTREKFLEHRIVLAQREWARFKANNSKECKACHDYKSMDFSKMRVTSQMIMRGAAERDASCVDCHKGIAHSLPSLEGAKNPAFDTLVSEASGVTAVAGGDYYSVSPQDLYLDPGLSQVIGSIEVATPVKVVGQSKDAVQVELNMWRKNKGFGRVWYDHFGLNITSAILDKKVSRDENLIEIQETREDEFTGLEWQKVSLTAWIGKGRLLESPEMIWNVARSTFSQSCSVCHRQPNEASHDANQWPGLFAGMVGFTSMDQDTAKLVLRYLQMHSSDFATAGEEVHGGVIQAARP